MQAFEQLESDLRRDAAGGSGASAGAFISRKKLVSVAVAGDFKCIAVKGRNARLLLRPNTVRLATLLKGPAFAWLEAS